jgi:hypothetical protein
MAMTRPEGQDVADADVDVGRDCDAQDPGAEREGHGQIAMAPANGDQDEDECGERRFYSGDYRIVVPEPRPAALAQEVGEVANLVVFPDRAKAAGQVGNQCDQGGGSQDGGDQARDVREICAASAVEVPEVHEQPCGGQESKR